MFIDKTHWKLYFHNKMVQKYKAIIYIFMTRQTRGRNFMWSWPCKFCMDPIIYPQLLSNDWLSWVLGANWQHYRWSTAYQVMNTSCIGTTHKFSHCNWSRNYSQKNDKEGTISMAQRKIYMPLSVEWENLRNEDQPYLVELNLTWGIYPGTVHGTSYEIMMVIHETLYCISLHFVADS